MKTTSITFALSPDDLATLREAAAASNVSLSAYVRSAALGYETPTSGHERMPDTSQLQNPRFLRALSDKVLGDALVAYARDPATRRAMRNEYDRRLLERARTTELSAIDPSIDQHERPRRTTVVRQKAKTIPRHLQINNVHARALAMSLATLDREALLHRLSWDDKATAEAAAQELERRRLGIRLVPPSRSATHPDAAS